MRKIYSLVLLAAALLVGTNAWAATYNVDVATYDALIAAVEGPTGTGEYVAGDIVNITLTSDLTYSLDNYSTPYVATDDQLTAAKNHISEIHRGQVVNVNLNNHNITSQALFVFAVYYGKLNLTGHGTITNTLYRYKENTKTSTKVAEASVVWMAGINQANCATDRTYLNVGPDVTLNCPNGKCGVYVYQLPTDNGYTTNTCTTYKGVPKNWSAKTSASKVCAYGVYADIYGTVHGYRYGLQMSGLINEVNIPSESNTPSIPTYYVHTGATVSSGSDAECAGMYLGGFSRAIISGTVFGATGVYVKSGLAEVIDATIYSNSSDYEAPKAGSSGKDATGSGIVIDSNVGYAGQIDVTISGDTKVTGNGGYAVEEKITTKDQANVSNVTGITIEGGTFEGGTQGCANFDNQTVTEAEDVTDETHIDIISGNYQGTTTTDSTLINNLIEATGGEVSMVTDPVTNKTTMVVATDPVPEADKTKPTTLAGAYAAQTAGEEHIYLTLSTSGTSTVDADLTLEKLDMSTGDHHVIVNNGVTLMAGRVLMNTAASIEVMAGGTLVITGNDGIYAPNVANLILHASDDAQARLLFNPNVTTNRHPNATVEFVSRSYRNSSADLIKQRFGIPTIGAVSTVTVPSGIAVSFNKFNYETDSWQLLGYRNYAGHTDVDPNDLNTPFASYLTQSNRLSSADPATIVLTGALVGNASPEVALYHNAWIALSNSYSGDMDVLEAVKAVALSGAQPAIYVNTSRGTGSYTWTGVAANDADIWGALPDAYAKLAPMQPFIIKNLSSSDLMWNLNYDVMVWTPYTNSSAAPARTMVRTDVTAIQIDVEGQDSYDMVRLAEAADFSADFDNGYDVYKYMNDAMNMYVSDTEKMSNFVTNDLENTYLGFSAKEAGVYTITFTNVRGNEYTLVDLATNTYVAITDGATYQFVVNDNEENDYRFKIVGRQEMPTDVETVENAPVKNGGIYTITGQYMGDMNEWNNLPAGLYIVNGEKKVK